MSGFARGGPDFYTAGRIAGRPTMSNSSMPCRPQFASIFSGQSPQIQRSDLLGKRTLAEFQAQSFQQQQFPQQSNLFSHLNQQQQQQFHNQQQSLGLYLRSVKPRVQAASPISPLSPADLGGNLLSESPSPSTPFLARYGLPVFQQLRPQLMNMGTGVLPPSNIQNFTVSSTNFVQNDVTSQESEPESEKKMRNRLQELEKQLLDDNDEEDVSVITNSEWSETIQSLINPNLNAISPSPTSSSSSSTSSAASLAPGCVKQSAVEAASAISEGKIETANKAIAQLTQFSNPSGTSEQRLSAVIAEALKSRLNPTENPPPMTELFSRDHMASVQLLYEHSPCFKLGFMAANLAIMEAVSTESNNFHVVDFNIGQGYQYFNLLHLLSLRKSSGQNFVVLKITAVEDINDGEYEERLKVVRQKLVHLGEKAGVTVEFNVLSLKIADLSRESLCSEENEVLVANFSYKLHRTPDESVTTENPRDEFLRRVKELRPRVVVLVEQEMHCNTAPLALRVSECCTYYSSLFDSLDTYFNSVGKDEINSEVKRRIEEGLSRRLVNSVACEGSDRIERCEVFGKWRARMIMAGLKLVPVSQHIAESLKARVNSGTRGAAGITVNEEEGGVRFGWMGRSLTVASAWR